jgi:DNA polymerase III delta prime subunit
VPVGLERLASAGRLYTSLILHGGSQEERLATAVRLARVLLCAGERTGAPGCECRHCRRIEVPSPGAVSFHPDVVFLLQDLRTVTSADATRQMLRAAQLHPFEARGQVFVIVNAETLSDEAANVLLKMLEEPPRSAPRNFVLLTPAPDRLLPTVRSRSLAVFLGPVERPDPERVSEVAAAFARTVDAFAASGSAIHLLAAADALYRGGDWDDPRDARPFAVAASAVMEAYRGAAARGSSAPREALLAIAEELLLAPEIRARNISAQRILEGLVAKHLAGGLPAA